MCLKCWNIASRNTRTEAVFVGGIYSRPEAIIANHLSRVHILEISTADWHEKSKQLLIIPSARVWSSCVLILNRGLWRRKRFGLTKMLSGLFINRDSTDIVLCESFVLFLVNGVSRTRVSPLAQHLPESHWKRSLGRTLRWPLKDIVNDALSYTYLLAMHYRTSGFYKPYCVKQSWRINRHATCSS